MSVAGDDFPARSGTTVYESGVAVTPHDTNQLAKVTKALYIGPAAGGSPGNIVVVWRDGTETTLTAVPPGVYRFRVRQVKAASTTATGIVALY